MPWNRNLVCLYRCFGSPSCGTCTDPRRITGKLLRSGAGTRSGNICLPRLRATRGSNATPGVEWRPYEISAAVLPRVSEGHGTLVREFQDFYLRDNALPENTICGDTVCAFGRNCFIDSDRRPVRTSLTAAGSRSAQFLGWLAESAAAPDVGAALARPPLTRRAVTPGMIRHILSAM
jgi:hypothetical protein